MKSPKKKIHTCDELWCFVWKNHISEFFFLKCQNLEKFIIKIRRIYNIKPNFLFFCYGRKKNNTTFFCSESIAIDKNFSQNQLTGDHVAKLEWVKQKVTILQSYIELQASVLPTQPRSDLKFHGPNNYFVTWH